SALLQGVADYEKKKNEAKKLRRKDPERYHALQKDLAEVTDRLTKAGFAQQSKAKSMKGGGIVTEVGPVVAKSVLKFFESNAGEKTLRRMNDLGIHPTSEKISAKKAAELPLAGKTFVLTGTLPSMTREEATEKIKALGGHVSGSVSGKTDYVLAGTEPGSKADKAKQLRIRILNEVEFQEIIHSSSA